jgi:hypothetical protein
VGSHIRLSGETEGMQLGLQRQREANEKTTADRGCQIVREYENAKHRVGMSHLHCRRPWVEPVGSTSSKKQLPQIP